MRQYNAGVCLWWVVVLSSLLGGCGSVEQEEQWDAQGEEAAEDEEALQGGRRSGAYAAVGLVVARNGATRSGSLIGPRAVLMAAHCATGKVEAFYLGRGAAVGNNEPLDEALETMDRHAVVDQMKHPGWERQTCGSTPDLAVLWLREAVVGVRPLRLSRADAATVGRSCTAVGFGMFGLGSQATHADKRSGSVRIVTVLPQAVWVGWKTAMPDHGDSGGPLLCGGNITGVVSCGDNGPVADRHIAYARPQAEPNWLRNTLLTLQARN